MDFDNGSNSGIWLFAILALFGFGGFGGYGNNRMAEDYAKHSDIDRAQNFSAILNGQQNIAADVQRTAYEGIAATKDVAYNNLSEIRDVQSAVGMGFADMQKCCCETLRAIDGINYNGAINTAAINANTTAQTQKILDALCANRMADMQNEINNLKMANAMAGVVRYPQATTYSLPSPCFNGGCSI